MDLFYAVMGAWFLLCALWYRNIAQRFRRAGVDVHWSWTAGTATVAALGAIYAALAAT